ncbi:unnamed protein product [Lactuca saligna]|uniref:TTF-type domain-containing protein n=1 Tax=Lactuca saligna TaxID=75948 RepID=A0AA35YUF9_LACSI|nr:unnamed protein product [Lactuca saligna]
MKSKQPSAYKKRKKRKLDEEKRKVDIGALDKFIHRQPVEDYVEEHIEELVEDHIKEHIEEQELVEVEETEEHDPVKDIVDIYDPRRWEKLNSNGIKILVEKGPKRDNSIMNGPYDKFGRWFSAALYTRTLSNLKKCDREWLVYSKELDRVFCFCCKVFRKGISKVVKFLAKHNLAFRGSNEKLFQKDNVKAWSLESLCQTHWESRVDNVKTIKLQHVDVREALLQVREKDNDVAAIVSEATSLAEKELSDFEFLVYEVLNHMNIVSKKLQSKDMNLDNVITEINKLIGYFKDYRETGFSKAIIVAKEIAIEMGIDPIFPQRRLIERKKRFDESSSSEEVSFTPKENFRVKYFLYIVDQVISSLKIRFEQFNEYDKDIATRVINHGIDLVNAKVMTWNPIFVLSDTSDVEALQKMVEGEVTRLLVIEKGRLLV